MVYCRTLLALPLMALAVLAAGGGGAAPVQDDAGGTYRDGLGDMSGLAVMQNSVVGPSLTPGVRVALSKWKFVQSYSPTADAISVPFSSGTHRLTTVEKTDPNAPWETVGLWQQEYRVASDLTLHSLVGTTTYWPGFATPQSVVARLGGIEAITPGDFFGGPFSTLAPGQGYTATLRSFYCDDPTCTSAKGPSPADGAEIGVFTVGYGALKTEFPLRVGSYAGTPSGDFFSEGNLSPATVEWVVPSPLPPGLGWEYRLRMTFSTDGQPTGPPCAPSCSVSLWVDTVTVMAKGRQIPATPVVGSGSCGPGQKPCNTGCIPDSLPCGWDVSTLYVTSGSYLSPVFDSLSDATVWNHLWWSVNQHFAGVAGGWPQAPIGIKWRVGNDPDPSTWLPNRDWFHGTIENSVTCQGEEDNCAQISCGGGPCDCAGRAGRTDCLLGRPDPYRVPMKDQGEATLFIDGKAVPAVGRYLQLSVDLSNNYANDRFPPEFQSPAQRELHDALRPVLKALRVSYTPARGMVVSKSVRPQQLRRWRAVEYATDIISGGTVSVDILDEFGVPLFTNVPSGFSLEGLAPDRYPALKMRAWVDNGGNPAQRPILVSWGMSWDTFSEPLQLDRNAIDLVRRDVVSITVVMTVSRPGTLSVHDASGQMIREFHQGVFGAGIRTFVWNGRNARGDAVSAGVYYVTLKAKEIRRIKKIAVLR